MTADMIHDAGAEVLFGRPHDVELWTVRLRRELATIEIWQYDPQQDVEVEPPFGALRGPTLALLLDREGKRSLIGDRTRFKAGDRVSFLIHSERAEEAGTELRALGWKPVTEEQTVEA